MKAAALRGALSDRAREGRIHVVSQLVKGDTPSTKEATATLKALDLSGQVLIVLTREEAVAWLSLRNLGDVAIVAPDQLNTYDVLISDHLVFTQAAYDVFVAGPVKGKGAKASATESEALA
jgi:large subunit ribosomal protein L4